MLTAKSGKTKLCQLRISPHVTCTVPACRSRSLCLLHHSTPWSARHSEMLCRPAPQLCPWGSRNTSFLQGFTRGLDSPSSDPAPEKQMPRFVSKRKQTKKTNKKTKHTFSQSNNATLLHTSVFLSIFLVTTSRACNRAELLLEDTNCVD